MLRAGQVWPTDFAWTSGMPAWAPLSQVLAGASTSLALEPPSSTSVLPGQVSGVPNQAWPTPPSMHWASVLFIGIATFGIFVVFWAFYQASFVKKLDSKNNTSELLSAYLLCNIVGFVLGVLLMTAPSALLGLLRFALTLASLTLWVVATFQMRTSLETHYQKIEPIGLRLDGVMTLFFNFLYFQYHFTRIAEWKERRRLA
jgi:hypothetical protein